MAFERRSDRIGSIGASRTARRMARRLSGALLAALLAATAAPVLAASLDLPPIVTPPSTEHHPGKVIFVELVTPDLAAAKHFYGELLGWSFRDVTSTATTAEYAEATIDGRAVAGIFQKKQRPGEEQRTPAWLSFFAVADVDAAEKTAVEKGGKLLFGPKSFAQRGRQAVLADPQGATFALLASSSGDPPDVLAGPGEWIWSTLITSDPGADAGFYQALFGYEVFDLPARPGAEHLLFASEEYARASANSLPTKRPEMHPHWLNHVRVVDAEKTAAQAVALGGHIVVAPHLDRQGGKVALIADPEGAVLGLLEWPENASQKVGE
jgi:uncharacterized protein